MTSRNQEIDKLRVCRTHKDRRDLETICLLKHKTAKIDTNHLKGCLQSGASLHSAYYHIEATIMLPFRYLMGDMFGAILVFGTVMVFRRSILKFIMGRVHG